MRLLGPAFLAATLFLTPAFSAGRAKSTAKPRTTKTPKAKPTASPKSPRVTVKGHTNKNGIYVAPHQRTSPNSTAKDNWSTKGNVNPNTGKAGTKDPKK